MKIRFASSKIEYETFMYSPFHAVFVFTERGISKVMIYAYFYENDEANEIDVRINKNINKIYMKYEMLGKEKIIVAMSDIIDENSIDTWFEKYKDKLTVFMKQRKSESLSKEEIETVKEIIKSFIDSLVLKGDGYLVKELLKKIEKHIEIDSVC